MQEKYDQWSKEVVAIENQCKIKTKIKKEKGKIVRSLYRAKRKLKKGEVNKKTILRRKLINKHIIEEKQQRYNRKIQKTLEELRKNGGGIKEESFWEFRRKLKGKQQEIVTSMADKNGEIKHERGNKENF